MGIDRKEQGNENQNQGKFTHGYSFVKYA